MRQFPAFVPQDLRLEGRGYLEAAADITLSSAGKHVLHLGTRRESVATFPATATSCFY